MSHVARVRLAKCNRNTPSAAITISQRVALCRRAIEVTASPRLHRTVAKQVAANRKPARRRVTRMPAHGSSSNVRVAQAQPGESPGMLPSCAARPIWHNQTNIVLPIGSHLMAGVHARLEQSNPPCRSEGKVAIVLLGKSPPVTDRVSVEGVGREIGVGQPQPVIVRERVDCDENILPLGHPGQNPIATPVVGTARRVDRRTRRVVGKDNRSRPKRGLPDVLPVTGSSRAIVFRSASYQVYGTSVPC